MAKLYYLKITNEEINPTTSEAWTLEDVPLLWRDEVQALLDENDG